MINLSESREGSQGMKLKINPFGNKLTPKNILFKLKCHKHFIFSAYFFYFASYLCELYTFGFGTLDRT